MYTSWINNTRIRTIAITIIATLHLSACSTTDFANAVADGLATDVGAADTVNTSGATFEPTSGTRTTNESGSTPTGTSTSEPTQDTASGSSAEPTSAPDPVSIPAPASDPAFIPTATTAMFSYNADLSNAQPLNGAVLEQATVYMFFGTGDAQHFSSMKFYCCKGTSGASNGENHSPSVNVSSAPLAHSVDLSQYNTTGTRELYVDAARADGTGYDSLTATFSINIPDAPVLSVSDIDLSWVAPSQREDNSGISPSEIAGYKIYYGINEGSYTESVYIDDGGTYEHTITNLTEGTYYFVITTHDTGGRESKQSSVVTKTI